VHTDVTLSPNFTANLLKKIALNCIIRIKGWSHRTAKAVSSRLCIKAKVEEQKFTGHWRNHQHCNLCRLNYIMPIETKLIRILLRE